MKRPPKRIRPPQPPTDIQLYVALRQLELVDAIAAVNGARQSRTLGRRLVDARNDLATAIGCSPDQLRIDHTWMLRVRAYKPRNGKPVASWYTPHAHDPEYLRWRPQGAEYAGSHHVKTFVRGEHGQYSDTALANRERHRERKAAGKTRPKRKWASRPFPSGRTFAQQRWQPPSRSKS